MEDFLRNVSIYLVPLLFGVILHEVAHGWVAEKLGDPTARMMGRITLNPISHVDLFGTIILPLTLLLVQSKFLFGWAKPVPVQFGNLRGGRRAMAWVALSGPLTNLTLAAASAMVYHLMLFLDGHGWIPASGLVNQIAQPVFLMARASVVINLVLMVVNLFPIPPLDGGRVMVGLLPEAPAMALAKLERYGMLIVLLLIVTRVWSYLLNPILAVFLQLFLR
ncbi:MAG TPA: site-2 protease family protein [Syntrophobacteraceae bacterium]|nr:site-2 protease family protein [Syntrophobacteraceae bacterium]